MRHKKELSLSAACLLLALLCSILWLYAPNKNLAAQISPHILRFHVLANSNSREDQEIKLQVKSFLLEELGQSPIFQSISQKEALCQLLRSAKAPLESKVNHYLESIGCQDRASLSLVNTFFPEKAYGDLTLPCGSYDALQVSIGDARGRNWWCVLYPQLCFVDAVHAIVPESSREQLKQLLPSEDYRLLFDKQGSRITVRFHLLDTLHDTFFDK